MNPKDDENVVVNCQEPAELLPQIEKLLAEGDSASKIRAIKLYRSYMNGFWKQEPATELDESAGTGGRLVHTPYYAGLKEAKETIDLMQDGLKWRELSAETRNAISRFRQLHQAKIQAQGLYDSLVVNACIRGVDDLLIGVKEELMCQMIEMLERIDL